MNTWLGLARVSCILAACSMLLTDPAPAQDALKELLDRAQSQAERQAVEELIRKLQSKRAAPPAAAPNSAPELRKEMPAIIEARPPAASVPVASETKPEPKQDTDAAPVRTESKPEPKREVAKEVAPVAPAEPRPAPRAPGVSDKAAVAAARQAVESADKSELPSVDLEVYFDLASTAITPQAATTLTPLGRALADPRLADGVFLIAGHSDAQGPARYNLRLSQRRAESVREFLITEFGIGPERLVAQGFGEERLKNQHNPAASENRRVQIVNMAKQASR